MNRSVLIAVFLLACAVFAGCREPDNRVHISIWHQKIGAEREFFEEVIRDYNRNHPDRVVELLYRETEELRNLFIVSSVGGKGPDLVFGPSDNVSVFALTGSIMPVDSVLPPAYLEQFDEAGVITWEDEPWMVADQVGNHLTFVFNREMMPEPPETTDEMIEMLQAQTADVDGDGRIDQYGLTWNYTEPFFFIPFLKGFGGSVMDEEGNPTLDNEATVKAIQFILDLRDRYRVIPGESDYNVAETLFKEGRAASIINGPWAWDGYASAGVEYFLSPIPRMSETGHWCAPYISSKGYSINANVRREVFPYVREVLEFLTSVEMQTRMAEKLSTIPVIEAARNAPAVQANPILQASLRQVEVGEPMPTAPQMRQIWDGMRGPYQLVMNGAITAEAGARLMQQEVEKRIADTFL